MTSLRRSVFIVLLSSNSLTVIGMLTSMIIARLLTPSQIGSYAVSAVLIGIAHQFRDFGVTNYLVHTPDLNKDAHARAFGLSLMVATALAFLVFAASYPLAVFYRAEVVGETLRVLALNFFLTPFGSITLALMRRDMRFKERAVIDHVSAFSGMAVSLIMAYRGYGTLALAWGTVASTIGTILMTSLYRSGTGAWIRPSFRALGAIASYGATITASSLLTQVNRGLAEMIGGRMLGMEAVGVFNKSRSVTDQIGSLLLGAANQVSLPVLSARHRDGEDIGPLYLKAVSMLTALTWPACVVAAIFPVEILRVMFGPQWDAAAPSLQLLCFASVLCSPYWLWTQALYAVGKQDLVLKGELFGLVSTAIIIIATLMAGSRSLAIALTLSAPMGLAYIHYLVNRALGLSNRSTLVALLPSVAVTVITAIGPLLQALCLPKFAPLTTLLICGPLTLLCWVAGVLVTHHPFSHELRRLLPAPKGQSR